jgi:hypothetical protein
MDFSFSSFCYFSCFLAHASVRKNIARSIINGLYDSLTVMDALFFFQRHYDL